MKHPESPELLQWFEPNASLSATGWETELSQWIVPAPAAWRSDELGLVFLAGPTRRYPARSDDAVGEEFGRLSAEWYLDARFMSSVSDAVMHPAYQRIIGLGPQVVPHLLRSLRDELQHWFGALTAIVGMDVADGATTIRDAAEKWLEWGRREGYIDVASG